MTRLLSWYSCGAASAVATKLSGGLPVYCETGSEHPDNARFLRDCEAWFGQSVTRLRSDEFPDTWSVWEKRRYIAGIEGAPCTSVLKIGPRLAFQHPLDVHVFGYTANRADVERAKRLRANYPELTIQTPLIDRGLTKEACLAMVERAGIKPPLTYAMGFPNANCIPCCKATSPAYWALVRRHFPAEFNRMALLSRELGARLCRLDGERAYIDEIPEGFPTVGAITPSCDFLCNLAEQDL